MSAAIEDLKNDHEAILFALGILESIGIKISEGEKLIAADILALIDFLREFADTCHHGKEEEILFPALEVAGIPRDGGPIGVMLHEHELGRKYLRGMRAAAESLFDQVTFMQNAAAYADLLRHHIEKENTVLFPMGERVLGEEAFDAIEAQFQRHEEEVIGAGRHAELHAMLAEFGRRYL